jgi:hypothetical protein
LLVVSGWWLVKGFLTQRRRGAEVERGMIFNRVEHVERVEMGRKQTTNRHKSTQIWRGGFFNAEAQRRRGGERDVSGF